MKRADAIMYPVKGVTLHRVAAGQRSQGDGQEQTASSVIRETPKPHKTSALAQRKSFGNETFADNKKIDGEVLKEGLQSEGPTSQYERQIQGDVTGGKGSEMLEQQVPGSITSDTGDSTLLPEVLDIAHKLTKVSVTSCPDSTLLNAPPKNLNAQKIIPIHPKAGIRRSGHKRKDPKFVPFEPYKGCVKPILDKRKGGKKAGRKGVKNEEAKVKEEGRREESEEKNAEKLSILVKDFERERAEWEQNTATLKTNMASLETQIAQMKNEKTNLESQLSVQSQINTELKKLLVASVGEDVQGRVQCLTEDKARMATMIRHYSERVDRDYEEKERIGIQCDVWRSKFLGSSMLVDELVGIRVDLTQQLEESGEALKMLLEEHQVARQHVLTMYRMNKQLRDAFDPLATASRPPPPLASADLVTLAVDGAGLAETVRDRLLGDLGRAVGDGLVTDGLETCTPGTKIARQLLSRISSKIGQKCHECSTVSPNRSALMQRFHPNARLDHLTVNCCSHCNGEIYVI